MQVYEKSYSTQVKEMLMRCVFLGATDFSGCDLFPHADFAKGKKGTFPIFIAGAPRSGTTLLLQAIITKYDVSFSVAPVWGIARPLSG